jgi:hypothetical protein
MDAAMNPVRFGGAMILAVLVGLAAAERGTPAEARAMLQKAVAHYGAVGRKQALADFTAKKAPFSDRDLYVVCLGPGGIITAHGLSATYVGLSADILKDANNKPLGTTIWTNGSSKGSGSIEYSMLNPTTKKVESKTSFFQKVGDDVCVVGAYAG